MARRPWPALRTPEEDGEAYPDTLAEMAPLYDAMAHGCATRKYQEAHDLYRDQIQRKEKYFSGDKLGALGADLAALSCFFATPWTEVVTELKGNPTEGFVLYEAGFYLRGLGRTGEALALVQKGLEVAIASKDWREASIRARLLNQTYLLLGDIPNALRVAQQSVKVADKSEDAFQRALNRSFLADIWHQAGELTKAEVLFKEFDDIDNTLKPTFQTRDWVPCYRYCDFLLTLKNFSEAQRRAGQQSHGIRNYSYAIHDGMTTLYLAKANFLEA